MTVDQITDVAANIVTRSSKENPMMTLLLVVIVALLAWFVWQNHNNQDVLIKLQLDNQANAIKRNAALEKLADVTASVNDRQTDTVKALMRLGDSVKANAIIRDEKQDKAVKLLEAIGDK